MAFIPHTEKDVAEMLATIGVTASSNSSTKSPATCE